MPWKLNRPPFDGNHQIRSLCHALAWTGDPDMPHMPESDVTLDTPWAGPGTARVNVMVGPVIPTI